MAKAKIKTTQNDESVEAFLNAIADEQQRVDSFKVDEIMRRVTGEEPKMWGPAIIGYGLRHVVSDSGREVDWLLIGFSPRKGKFSLYVGLGGDNRYGDQLARLGKHKTGKGCLYINKLSDIDVSVLEELISASYKRSKG